MVVERFSGPLLSNPEVIFELIPLFCPSKSFLKPVAERSKISIDELPHHEWDNYVATFTTYHGCRGSKIVSTNENFAVSTSTQEGLVLVYGSYRTSPIRKLVHGERVVSLLFNHSRTTLATYGSMSTKLWDISTGTSLHTFTNAPDRNVLALAFTGDDKEIFAFCDDYILRKASINSSFHDWESIDLRLHGEYGNRWINPSCATFDHQSKLLAIGFTGDPLEIWDLLSFACIGRLGEETGLQYDLKQLNWSPQSDRIIARHRNGSLSVLDISRNEIIATCVDTTSTMASNSTVGFLVTGDRAGTIKVRRISDLALLYQIQGSESVIALSVAPSSGKIYDIRGTDCTVWEPSLLARVTAHIEDRDPLFPLAHLLQAPTLNSNVPPVTSLATCPRSSTYCVGYADGHIEVSLHGKEKIALDLPTKTRIERLLWCPNGRYLAIVDLAARIFVVSLDQQSCQFQTLIFSQLKSFVEQILFKRSSGFLLVVTRDDIVTWDLDTSVMAASRHTLGSDSRWINHPKKDNLLVGIGPRDIEIRQWHDHRIVSGISLNNSIAELTFCLEVLDYVKTEPSAVNLHPSVATCKVNKILISPDTSMMLLVTTRETKESISAPQFLLVSVADLDNAIISLQGVVCPIPLIESLSDVIAMPLAFLSRNSDERGQRQLPGGHLVFLDKENWICSVWVNAFNKEHPVQRHIFLPSDWLKLESVEFVQLGPGGEILIPKSEHIAIIRNALDVQY